MSTVNTLILILLLQAVKLDTTTLTDKEKLEAANQKIMELEACKKVLEDTVHKEIKKIPGMFISVFPPLLLNGLMGFNFGERYCSLYLKFCITPRMY